MRNPYEVLGLNKTAAAADIKSSFRKLAKKYHPDQSKEVKAKERFSEVNQAYEILGDDKKRAAFDRGEIDAEGKPRAPDFGGFGFEPRRSGARAGGAPSGNNAEHFEFNFGGGRGGHSGLGGDDAADILSQFFGGGGASRSARRGPPRGSDIAVTAQVPLEAAAAGGSVRVNLSGGRAVEIKAPAAMEDGMQIRLRGQGEPAPAGGEAGDAMVTLKLAPHPQFRVEGRDLRHDLALTPYECGLGAKINVPTLQGTVELNIPPGSNGGRVLRLRGKGLPATDKAAAGDLLVTLRIMLPEALDSVADALMRQWQATSPFDPRKL